jgi:nucleoside-diphosphate-sugar epimerase
MESVLVTGAGGFMGSHLVERLLDDEVQVTAIVRRTSTQSPQPAAENLAGRVGQKGLTVAAVDLAGPAATDFLSQQDARIWIHLAADAYVPASFTEPSAVIRNNVVSTVSVLDAAVRRQPELVIVASSSEVYGHNDDPIGEDGPLRPTTPYAASKVATDHIAMSYFRSFGAPVVVVRPFNCYGPRHRYDVIPLFIARALRNQPLTVNGDGEQTRDYTYVSDTVDALMRICTGIEPGRVFNIGSGRDTSVIDLGRMIKSYAGSDSPIEHGPARLGEVRRMCCSAESLTAATGWRAQVPLEEGLQRTIEHARLHLQ